MLFKVTKQYGRGTDIPVSSFKEENDARLFIQAKLEDDARLKIKVVYRLYDGMELMQEFQPTDESSGGSGSSQQRSSFQPSPFNATPRPAGMPSNWVKDDDKKK